MPATLAPRSALPSWSPQASPAGGGLGERLAVRRRQHGLSRKVVANLVGRSEEWLRQVERGHRELDSITVLRRLSQVLHIRDIGDFLGWDSGVVAKAPVTSSLTAELRAVLLDTPGLCPATPVVVAPLPRLHADLERADDIWRRSPRRYAELAATLPTLLRHGRAAWRGGDRSPELRTILLRSYGLARLHAHRLGDEHLAWVAAEQCVAVAEQSDRPLDRAITAVHRVACMRAMNYQAEARRLAVDVAATLDEHAPVRGALLVQAAEAAAAEGLRHEAITLLDLAHAVAARIGAETSAECVPFGPAEVGMRETRLLMRLGQLDAALRLARELVLPDELSIDQRTTHLITMAYGYSQVRDDVAAVFALNRVAASSPDDLRLNQFARSAVQRLSARRHVLIADDLGRLSELTRVS